MRLRDISELVRENLERGGEGLFGADVDHALVLDIREVQTLYRTVLAAGRTSELVPWLAFSFEPHPGLIEPFNIYPGRFVAMMRVHRQSSGLPELVLHIDRQIPGASTPIEPDLFVSFSQSSKIHTVVQKVSKDPLCLRFFHKGTLLDGERALPPEPCLAGISEALPEGSVDDGLPGMVDLGNDPAVYVGEIVLYNQGQTPDRPKLRNFLLNALAVAVVARYVRDVVRKNLA